MHDDQFRSWQSSCESSYQFLKQTISNMRQQAKMESERCTSERALFSNCLIFYDQYENHLQPVYKFRDKIENLGIHTAHSVKVFIQNLEVKFNFFILLQI